MQAVGDNVLLRTSALISASEKSHLWSRNPGSVFKALALKSTVEAAGLYISQVFMQNTGYFFFLCIKRIRSGKSKMNYLNAEEFLILYITTVSNRQQLTMILFMHFILLVKKNHPTGVSV